MSTISIQPTYPIFTDIDGQPLENGYVWIGTLNLDPQTNPIVVYWDAALTIPAAQPIRTIGGYLSNNGSPANIYAAQEYSIRVMNKNGSVIYSAANGAINNVFFSAIGESLSTAASAAAARSVIGAAVSGANNDITSLSGLTTALSIAQGGTGAVTASAARTALGLAIGTDVQAYNVNLRPFVQSTAVASTSGTIIDFTGIPSWAKRITVMFDGVSTSGTSILLLQLGDSGGIEATGYTGVSSVIYGTTPTTTSSTGGFPVNFNQASNVTSGACVFTLLSGNTWTATGIFSGVVNSAQTAFVSGVKATSDTLDRVRITTLNGTDTFDSGSINILYE